MKSKRIIPCLDIRDRKVVKGINFEGVTTVGDPVKLAQKYDREGADELVFLDITASTDGHELLLDLIREVAQNIHIPLIVGGGINTVERARNCIRAGAAKVSIGSPALLRPKLLTELAQTLGKERIIIAIDTKPIGGMERVHIKGGKEATDKETVAWAQEAQKLGAGEILLTSVETDGMQKGFALDITDRVSRAVDIPVIASGGAGSSQDFIRLFSTTRADAGLAASIFHYGKVTLRDLKKQIENR